MTNSAQTPQTPARKLSAWVRVPVSILLLIHLGALLAGPLAVPPASRMFGEIWEFYSPYLEAAYLNHGYHFFAPEPGPSNIIRYEVTRDDGEVIRGHLPNLDEHWPRLLYHRHFMLTEFVNTERANNEESTWHMPYARHLLHKYHGQQVKLDLVRHMLPRPFEALGGMKLDDPRLFETLPLGTYTEDDFAERQP